jgi:hypothetical protein
LGRSLDFSLFLAVDTDTQTTLAVRTGTIAPRMFASYVYRTLVIGLPALGNEIEDGAWRWIFVAVLVPFASLNMLAVQEADVVALASWVGRRLHCSNFVVHSAPFGVAKRILILAVRHRVTMSAVPLPPGNAITKVSPESTIS